MNIFSIILLLSVTFVDANSTNAGTFQGSGSRSRLEYTRLESEIIPCEEAKITVEFMTDKYPMDNYWSLTDMRGWEDNETVFKFTLEGYTEMNTLYKKEFCLPESTYELIVYDTYGDGVCCVQGNGYYRVLDKCGRVILDSGKNSEPFIEQSHSFEVHSNDSDDICSPMGYCEDHIEKSFRWKKNKGRSLTCQEWAQKNYCNTEILNNDNNNKGKFIREVCQKSCDKCDTMSTTIDATESPIFSDSKGGTPISTATPTATNEAACANSSDSFIDNEGELTTCAAIHALDFNKKEKKCNKASVIKNCRGICDEECHE